MKGNGKIGLVHEPRICCWSRKSLKINQKTWMKSINQSFFVVYYKLSKFVILHKKEGQLNSRILCNESDQNFTP